MVAETALPGSAREAEGTRLTQASALQAWTVREPLYCLMCSRQHKIAAGRCAAFAMTGSWKFGRRRRVISIATCLPGPAPFPNMVQDPNRAEAVAALAANATLSRPCKPSPMFGEGWEGFRQTLRPCVSRSEAQGGGPRTSLREVQGPSYQV